MEEKKQCCLCENNNVKSIREIVNDKLITKYYCKDHDPLKNVSNRWATNIGKEIIKEIITDKQYEEDLRKFCCTSCEYKIIPNKKYKQCQVCKYISKLNYLEECYGLNYEEKLKRMKKTHKRMNNKRIVNGKVF